MHYVVIEDQVFNISGKKDSEIAAIQNLMFDLGIKQVPVWSGDPDGPDGVKTSLTLSQNDGSQELYQVEAPNF